MQHTLHSPGTRLLRHQRRLGTGHSLLSLRQRSWCRPRKKRSGQTRAERRGGRTRAPRPVSGRQDAGSVCARAAKFVNGLTTSSLERGYSCMCRPCRYSVQRSEGIRFNVSDQRRRLGRPDPVPKGSYRNFFRPLAMAGRRSRACTIHGCLRHRTPKPTRWGHARTPSPCPHPGPMQNA